MERELPVRVGIGEFEDERDEREDRLDPDVFCKHRSHRGQNQVWRTEKDTRKLTKDSSLETEVGIWV